MMKKNIYYRLIGLALLIVSIAACDTADQDTSPVVSPTGYTKATFTTDFTGTSVTEGDTIVYNVTTDKLIDRSLTFNARINEGTSDDEDITVIPGVLAPYTNSTTVTVIFNQDWDVETTETMKLEFGVFGIADRYLLNATTVNPIINVTVNNFVSDVVNTYFGWDTDFTVLNFVKDSVLAGYNWVVFDDTVEVNTNTAKEMDFGIILSSATGFDIADAWGSDIIDFIDSGDNPETIDIESLADGEYVLWSFLWMNWAPYDYDSIKDPTVKAPIVAYFERQGTDMAVEITQPDDQAPTVNIGGDDGPTYYGVGPNEPFEGIVAYLIVADGKYSVKEIDGTITGPYKAGKIRTPRPDSYNRIGPPRTR